MFKRNPYITRQSNPTCVVARHTLQASTGTERHRHHLLCLLYTFCAVMERHRRAIYTWTIDSVKELRQFAVSALAVTDTPVFKTNLGRFILMEFAAHATMLQGTNYGTKDIFIMLERSVKLILIVGMRNTFYVVSSGDTI